MPLDKGKPQQNNLFVLDEQNKITHLHGEPAVHVGPNIVPRSEFLKQLEEARAERAEHHSP